MADNKERKRGHPNGDGQVDPEQITPEAQEQKDLLIEEDPAVERGERIATSKQIARGGKQEGSVPGATAKPSE